MTVRALFFDLDDTLCATTQSRPERARRAFQRLLDDHPKHEGLVWSRFYRGLLERDRSTGFIRGIKPVLEELGLAHTPAGQAAHGLWYFDGCTDLVCGYPGLADCLDMLGREFVLGLITNGEGEHQRRKLDALGVAHHFQHVLVSGEVGHLKPEAAIFRRALALAGVAASEAVHIGDHLDADIWGAKAAGLRAVWFNAEGRDPYWHGVSPDATVSSYRQLHPVLERWR
jgi:putative hydrolase of the HAD superfamily